MLPQCPKSLHTCQSLVYDKAQLDEKLTELRRTLDTERATLRDRDTRVYQLKAELNQLKTTLDSRNTQLNELQQKLVFLRLQFDTDQAEGIPKPDLLILVKEEKDTPLYAHKIVLASRSSVFTKMFETEMLECETGTVRIEDATRPVISAVIRFCYQSC